jgi:hypothetical protein
MTSLAQAMFRAKLAKPMGIPFKVAAEAELAKAAELTETISQANRRLVEIVLRSPAA